MSTLSGAPFAVQSDLRRYSYRLSEQRHPDTDAMFVEAADGDARAALSNALNINRRLMIELRELAGQRAYDRLRAAESDFGSNVTS